MVVGLPFFLLVLLLAIPISAVCFIGVVWVGAHRFAFKGKVDFPWSFVSFFLREIAGDFGILDLTEEIKEERTKAKLIKKEVLSENRKRGPG